MDLPPLILRFSFLIRIPDVRISDPSEAITGEMNFLLSLNLNGKCLSISPAVKIFRFSSRSFFLFPMPFISVTGLLNSSFSLDFIGSRNHPAALCNQTFSRRTAFFARVFSFINSTRHMCSQHLWLIKAQCFEVCFYHVK